MLPTSNDFLAKREALALDSIPDLATQKAQLLEQRRKKKVAHIDPNAAADESAQDVYDSLYGDSSSDSNFIDAFQAGSMNLFSNGAELLGEGIESTGKLVDSDWLTNQGTQIQKEQQLYRNTGAWDDYVGYDSTPSRQLGERFADAVDREDYWGATKEVFSDPVASIESFTNSVPQMVAMSNPYGLGAVILANINKGLNDIGPNATTEQKEISAALSTVGTLTDRLGDKVLFGGGSKVLKKLVGSMSEPAQRAVKAVYGKASVRLGVGAANFAGKTVTEGGTEGIQTLLEGKASDVDKMNFNVTPKERRAALEATGIAASSGGVVAAPPLAKDVAVSAGTTAIKGTTTVANKALDYGNRKVKEAQYMALSPEDREKIKEEYDKNTKAHEKFVKVNDRAIESIKSAKSAKALQEYNDPVINSAIDAIMSKNGKVQALRKRINNAGKIEELPKDTIIQGLLQKINSSNESKTPYTLEETKDLLNRELDNRYKPTDLEANLDKIKSKAVAQYNLLSTNAKVALEAARAKDVIGQVHSNLYDAAKRKFDKLLPVETRDAIVAQAKKGIDLTKAGYDVLVDEAKNIDKSAARAIIDDISEGRANKAMNTFTKRQLRDLKKGFKGNEKAQRLLDRAIEKQGIVKSSFDSYLKSDNKVSNLFDQIVDTTGNILDTDVATKIRGLASVTQDYLTDNDNLSRYKKLVKDLEKEQEKNPEEFSKEAKARLVRARRNIIKAKRAGDEGAINAALTSLRKGVKKASRESEPLYRKTIKKLEEYGESLSDITDGLSEDVEDMIAKVDKAIDELDSELTKKGEAKSGTKRSKSKVKKTKKPKEKVPNDIKNKLKNMDFSSPEILDDLDDIMEKVGEETLANYLSYDDINTMVSSGDEDLKMIGGGLKFFKEKPSIKPSVEDTKVSDGAIDTTIKNLDKMDFKSPATVNKLNKEIDSVGIENLAALLSDEEIDIMVKSADKKLKSIGEELKVAKKELSEDDADISTASSKKLSAKMLESKDDELESLVDILCKDN